MALSTSWQRLSPYIGNALVLLALATIISNFEDAGRAVAALIVSNLLIALVLLIARRGALAASFAVSALYIIGLLLIVGLVAAVTMFAPLLTNKIGG